MINKNELIFVVDEDNNPLEPLPRHMVHKNVLWHRTTGIWVINDKNQILCQKRSMKKDTKPGFWEAFFGGHVNPDETYNHNAIHELSEELGINVDEEKLMHYNILKSDKPTHKEFQGCYIYKIDRDDIQFSFEKEEIDEIKWFDCATLKKYLVTEPDPRWVHKPWDDAVLKRIIQTDNY